MNAKASFPVRRQDFDFAEVSRHWVDNDPFMTHFFNSLSALFPDGERFFVDSVRAVREQIKDPVLQKEIGAFIGQEAMHAKEHHNFNAGAKAQGFDIEQLERWTNFLITLVKTVPFLNNKRCHLAGTVALEHFTGVLSARLMKRPDISEMLEPTMRELWLWHCVEENEHKAVAFDTYRQLYGDNAADYVIRMSIMALATVFILGAVHVFTAKLMSQDGQLLNLKSWGKGLWRIWGPKGMFSQNIIEYFDYFRPSFHPWDHDTKDLLAEYTAKLNLAR